MQCIVIYSIRTRNREQHEQAYNRSSIIHSMDGGFIQGIALQNISLMCRVVIHVRSKPPWNNSATRTTTTANYTKIRPNGPYDTLYRVQRETRLRKTRACGPAEVRASTLTAG